MKSQRASFSGPIARTAIVTVLGALALLASCASVRVSVDYDPEEDFSVYRAYAWLPEGPIPSGDVRVDNELIARHVVDAVESTLREQGFEKDTAGDPDFYVNYTLSVQSALDTYTVNRVYVDHYGWAMSLPETRARPYDEGTLIIDIADAREEELVWRGVGKTRVSDYGTNETVAKTLNETVAEILKAFPPAPGGSQP